MSAAKELYRQCKMQRSTGYHTAYIPIAFAKHGKLVIIDGMGEEPWTVIEVYQSATREQLDTERGAQKAFEYVLG